LASCQGFGLGEEMIETLIIVLGSVFCVSLISTLFYFYHKKDTDGTFALDRAKAEVVARRIQREYSLEIEQKK